MALGSEHDKVIKILSIPFGLLMSLIFANVGLGVTSSIAFLLGGLFLSPDLDTYSKPLKRWGILKVLWGPYRKLIPHRSFLSHSPFLGTALKVIYIIVIYLLLGILFSLFNNEPILLSFNLIEQLIKTFPETILVIIIGLEGSVWIHLIQDWDPIPKKWLRIRK